MYIYRGSNYDPIYHSTDEWKTLKQWRKLGYRLKFSVKTILYSCGMEDQILSNNLDKCFYYVNQDFFPTRVLVGYTNRMCQYRVLRFHKSVVRKIKKCPTKR